ncbi:hypothetical protein [Niabella beijingensis]|uniref:hypothetical protein n=1 Tax=Niabella beijingensis TaxID=2872700 RepID=UPI001CBFDD1A|nr:hypothetical protein [Niabella beijingensis]MBZ4191863.1 hypothetical protein [Niabella beijingensis]
MKRGSVLIFVYSLLFAGGFLLFNSTQKAVPASSARISLQKDAGCYTATPDLPVLPPDLFWDRTDDKEEDAAPGLYEHSFADLPQWVFSWITNHYRNFSEGKPCQPPYLTYLTQEKYIFFRSIRV